MVAGGMTAARVVFAGMIAAGVACGGLGFLEWRHVRDVEARYVPVPCTVEKLDMNAERTVRDARVVSLYTPAVEYRYQLDGVTVRGNRVAVRFDTLVGLTAGQEFEAQYGRGAAATCYHDPDSPTQSVLIRESSRSGVRALTQAAGTLLGLAAVGWGLLEVFAGRSALPPRVKQKRNPYAAAAGRSDEPPANDPLARSRRILDARHEYE